MNEEKEKKEQAGIKLSSKDWHYKLMQWFWTSRVAPSKNNVYNLCPYFWMLVATLILLPIITPFRFVWYLISEFADFLDRIVLSPIMETSAENWYANLTEEELYKIYNASYTSSRHEKYFKTILGDNYTHDVSHILITEKWLKEKKSMQAFDRDEWNDFSTTSAFTTWREKIAAKRRKDAERREAKKKRFEESMENFRDSVSNSMQNTNNFILTFSTVIKWTKRFVGAVITIFLALVSYVVVLFMSKGTLALVSILTLDIMLNIGSLLFIVLSFVGIAIGIGRLVNYADVNGWKEYWWATLFMYFIGYPVYYVLFIPGKILFYYFVYELILKNIFYAIKSIIIGIKNGFIEFGGIFGAYFGATKGDYCPGIEWVDDEDDEKADIDTF